MRGARVRGAAGDVDEFEDLRPRLFGIAYRTLGSVADAEDVVQEAWIALLKGIDGFEGRSSLRTWLFTVLINIAKKRGVRDRRESDAQIAAYTGGTVNPARFCDRDERWSGARGSRHGQS